MVEVDYGKGGGGGRGKQQVVLVAGERLWPLRTVVEAPEGPGGAGLCGQGGIQEQAEQLRQHQADRSAWKIRSTRCRGYGVKEESDQEWVFAPGLKQLIAAKFVHPSRW
ncbi:hypothetical protein HNY73_014672 [Argiope bruennichi]|uniref:Uncharacterized protein n=1 Tax=Argiope bruennichi TaxID=94029 RepID=A0A8T0ER99_ARGBR|nr:hypothetical protein HNY73_014672 [Argiope bruennichi]